MIILFVKLFLSFLLTYIIGTVLHKVFITSVFSQYKRIFIKILLGVLFQISIFAIIKTGFVTINVGILLLAFLFLLRNKFKINLEIKDFKMELSDLKKLGFVLPILLLFFAWRYYTLYSTETLSPVVINMDSLKHVIRAGFLVQTGIESVNVNYLILPTGVDPYHYFEAWTIGYFGVIFSENYWVAEQIIVFPLVSTIIVLGFWGIIERWNPKWYVYLISIGIVVATGLYFPFIEQFKYFQFTGGFSINAFDEWKGFTVSFAYLVILLFLNLLFSKTKASTAVLSLLLLPIISITLAPGILIISTTLLLLMFLFRKKLDYNIKITDLLIPFVIAIFIFVFYKIFEPQTVYISKPNALVGVKKLLSIVTLKTYIIIFIEKVFQSIILFAPYLFILIMLFVKRSVKLKVLFKKKEFHVLSFIVIAGSLIAFSLWMLFYGSFGSSQFLFYTITPFVNVLAFLVLIYSIIKFETRFLRSLSIVLSIALIFGFSIRTYNIYKDGRERYFDKYSVEYINAVCQELSKLDRPFGLKIENPSEFEKFNDTHHLVGNFLPGSFNNSNLVSLTLGEMYLDDNYPSKEAEMLIPKAPFSSYCKDLMNKNKFIDFEQSVQSFINEFNIKIVFVSPNTIVPNYIEKLKLKEIVDSNTGERMIVLNTN